MTYYFVPPADEGGGQLTILEAIVLASLLGWRLHGRGVHIVLCFVAGLAAGFLYCLSFSFTANNLKIAFFLLSAICIAFWGYIGHQIGLFFWPHDAIWQVTIALVAAALSFFDKKSILEGGY